MICGRRAANSRAAVAYDLVAVSMSPVWAITAWAMIRFICSHCELGGTGLNRSTASRASSRRPSLHEHPCAVRLEDVAVPEVGAVSEARVSELQGFDWVVRVQRDELEHARGGAHVGAARLARDAPAVGQELVPAGQIAGEPQRDPRAFASRTRRRRVRARGRALPRASATGKRGRDVTDDRAVERESCVREGTVAGRQLDRQPEPVEHHLGFTPR